MVLPLNLAMTAAELSASPPIPEHIAWMACHFSPWSQGLANIPKALPPGSMLILNDRMPCQGHSPGLAAEQLARAAEALCCEAVLLDFQRPAEAESAVMVRAVMDALPCPAAVTESYAKDLRCAVFLSPAPLYTTLEDYLAPWQDREVWLEAALCQQTATVTPAGTVFQSQFPTDSLTGGFYDGALCCRYRTEVLEDAVRFTLFDTPGSLAEKLKKARSLGVARAVGLYQELGTFLTGQQSSCPAIAQPGKP